MRNALVQASRVHAVYNHSGILARMRAQDSVTQYFKLSGVQSAALKRLGISTIGDLLRHFPTRYESAGASNHASAIVPGTKVTLFGTLS